MKWYDYVLCLVFADLMTAGILGPNMILSWGGFGVYIMYEKMRNRTRDNV